MRPMAGRGLGGVVGMLFLTAIGPVAAQVPRDPPLHVLRIPMSVRTVGLNGAAAALVGDAGSVFTNPAGLATLRHIGLEGAYRHLASRGFLASGALGWRLRQFDLGFGVRYLDFGDDPSSYLGLGAAPGSNAREALGVGSLVYRFGLIAIGVSGKYARRSVDQEHLRAVSADAGLAIAVFDIMALAFAVQNIGGNWRDASSLAMPGLSRLGFTMHYVDPQESFRLMSTVEVQWPDGESARLVVGGEAGVVLHGVGVVGRAGYGGRSGSQSSTRFTYGGTVQVGGLKLDYAYRSTDLLDRPAHYFGTRLTL